MIIETLETDAILYQCAILAAAVIGSFSWNSVSDAYWLAPALWHCSLVLSILGILLSAQQVAVLNLMGELPTRSTLPLATADVRRYLVLMLSEIGQQELERESQLRRNGLGVWKPRWKMVFVWQCPIMFMSYSVCLFLAGLTVLVCTPLIRGGDWSTDANVSFTMFDAERGCTFRKCAFIDVR